MRVQQAQRAPMDAGHHAQRADRARTRTRLAPRLAPSVPVRAMASMANTARAEPTQQDRASGAPMPEHMITTPQTAVTQLRAISAQRLSAHTGASRTPARRIR